MRKMIMILVALVRARSLGLASIDSMISNNSSQHALARFHSRSLDARLTLKLCRRSTPQTNLLPTGPLDMFSSPSPGPPCGPLAVASLILCL